MEVWLDVWSEICADQARMNFNADRKAPTKNKYRSYFVEFSYCFLYILFY